MNTNEFKQELTAIVEWLKKEYQSIRTGQASPAVLDGVSVDSYGSMMPLAQVASISIEGAKSLFVAPYDKSQLKEVEKAIIDANLGVSVVVTDSGARIVFPDLTTERRELLSKLAKQKLEDARVSIRKERDTAWGAIQQLEKDGEISEDERFNQKEDMEKIVKEYNAVLEELYENKQAEVAL